jgi:hypothetical protein
MKLFASSLFVTRILYPAKSRKNAQTLEYQKECTDPGKSERMHRPWNIRKTLRSVYLTLFMTFVHPWFVRFHVVHL